MIRDLYKQLSIWIPAFAGMTHETMDILNQFGINPILLAAQVVNFLILLFILKRFLYKPILKVLDERKQRITDSLKNAEEIQRRLLETHEQSEKIIAKTMQESQKILDETNQTAVQILADVNKTGEKILERAVEDSRKLIVLEKENLMREVKENVSDIVILALQKITGKVLKKKDQKQIVEEALKEIEV